MNCPQCKFANPAGMKFCGECGARLARTCAACGVESPPGFKFCGECGAPLGAGSPVPTVASSPPAATEAGAPSVPAAPITAGAAAAPPAAAPRASAALPTAAVAPGPSRPSQLPNPVAAPYTPQHLAAQVLRSPTVMEGERKQVTVLFCDLVSSTALADRIGPEAMHGLLRRFFELALGEVHRFGGTINQFLGDGFMALFGAPVAREDHARRAVLTALAVRRALARHGQERGDAGDAGNAGNVANTGAAGAGAALEATAFAELAVRMGLNTGWVVVGGLGDHLRMDYTAVGDTTNLAARLQQLAAAGEIVISEATRAQIGDDVQVESLGPAMVKGRSAPVTAYRLLGAADRGGETEWAPRDLSPLVGREQDLGVLTDLFELASAGRGQVAGIAGEAGAGKSRLVFELRRRLQQGRQLAWYSGRCVSYGESVPYLPLLSLLRNAWGIAEADAGHVAAAKVAAGLARLGAGAGESAPYLLELLGARNGSEALAELGSRAIQERIYGALRQVLLQQAARCGVLVVEIEDLHWIDPTSEEFLAGLVEELAGARLLLLLTYRSGYRASWMEKSYATQVGVRPLSASQSRALVEAVLRRSDVPPELTAAMLKRAEGNPFFLEELARSIDDRVTLSGEVVPDTVQAVLMARIDRLPDEHKRLLQAAAVLGREVPRGLLTAVWNADDGLDGLLQDLKRWEFFHESRGADGQAQFIFRHALTQEAVYQSLLTNRRQALHAAAGRALEQLFAGRLEDASTALAYHFPQTNEAAKAVTYLALAAEAAARRYAHAEAAKALAEALRHAERLPEPERDRRVIELALQLAHSLLPLARFPETLELCLAHRERVERLGDDALAGRFYFWLAHTYSYLGDQAQAAAGAERAIAHSAACGDEVTLAKAHYVLARDGFWSGQFALGVDHALQAVALLERHGERWWRGQAYWVAGFNDYALGRMRPALDAMAQAQAIGEALADPRLDASWSSGYFYASMGEFEAAIRDCRGGLDRSRDPLNSTAALGFLGYAYLEQGDPQRAVEALETAVEALRKAGFRQMLGWFCAFLAEASLGIGRAERGRLLAAEALEISRETRFGYGAGMAQRALGRIARQAGTATEAAGWLEQALATFSELGARFEVGRAHLDLVSLAQDRNDTRAAERHLGLAGDLFRQLGTPRYSERVERLAAQLAGVWLEEAAGGAPTPPIRR
jgi:class 3 adenylate cyclase/tetratricopeptide (TPR) repeat protein